MSGRVRAHIRQNVVAYVAVFIALGGTAWAVDGPLPGQNQVGSDDIINSEVTSADIANAGVLNADLRSNAVTTDKIAAEGVRSVDVLDDSLSGADINEATLNGVDAGKVDGLDGALIDEQTSGTTATPIEVLSLGGLVLRLECVNTDFFEPRLVAATTVDDAIFKSRAMPEFGTDEVEVLDDDSFDTGSGDEKTLFDAEQGSGLINYRAPGGTGVTVHYMLDGTGTSVGGCTISGTAFGGSG